MPASSERWDLFSYDDKLFWLSLTLKFYETLKTHVGQMLLSSLRRANINIIWVFNCAITSKSCQLLENRPLSLHSKQSVIQLIFACSKSAIETLKKSVKYGNS